MKRVLTIVGFGLVALVVGLGWYGERRWGQARVSDDIWASYETAKVTIDARGIPTIEGDTWVAVVEAQGFVMAAERFFHMDVLRRAAAGRMAELFGSAMVKWDRGHQEEAWMAVADEGYEKLPGPIRELVDAYAKGVNAFLAAHPDRAGIEYKILGLEPEPWKGRDSLLVLMIMVHQLAQSAPGEAVRSRWKAELPAQWFDFMFPENHPYNRPLFGDPPQPGPVLPDQRLEHRVPAASEFAGVATAGAGQIAAGPADPGMAGAGASNNWAWCGQGNCFLANDPHLGATVPHVWFAARLRKSAKEWVVGVSLPGIPGVTLGMNPYLAWAFTNTGEDVDDFLEEKLSEDGARYLAEISPSGEEVWKDVQTREYSIAVKGGEAVTGVSRFTHRGPLSARDHLDPTKEYSRQWLALMPEMLRLPLGVNFANSWPDMNYALDDMRLPAQNVVVVDHYGNIGYRASGTGVRRAVPGRFPQPALQGQWKGLQPYEERPRLLIGPKDESRSATTARYLATANERIWIDDFGQRWAEDLRAERIRSVLSSLQDASMDDMQALQLDTVSRFHRDLVRWVAARAAPNGPEQEQMVARWTEWDGASEGHPMTIAEALAVEEALKSACVGRVRGALLSEAAKDLPYRPRLPSAWMITALSTEGGFEVFGFDEAELAEGLLEYVATKALEPHPETNRWRAQHPFVGRVPLIGDRFKVKEHPQAGHYDVPRVETPKYGASCRLLWDLGDPKNSRWALPVGQSGHPSSPHYSDFMTGFRAGQTHPVFEDDLEWWFEERAERPSE